MRRAKWSSTSGRRMTAAACAVTSPHIRYLRQQQQRRVAAETGRQAEADIRKVQFVCVWGGGGGSSGSGDAGGTVARVQCTTAVHDQPPTARGF